MKEKDYIIYGFILLGLGLILFYKKGDKNNSGFIGASTTDVFKSPYTKDHNGEGFSQLFRLSDYFVNPTREIRDYTPVEIIETRILDGRKYFQIYKGEWILAKDVRKPIK